MFGDYLLLDSERQLIRRVASRMQSSTAQQTPARHQMLILAGAKAMQTASFAFAEVYEDGGVTYSQFRKEWIHSAMLEQLALSSYHRGTVPAAQPIAA